MTGMLTSQDIELHCIFSLSLTFLLKYLVTVDIVNKIILLVLEEMNE